MDRSSRPTASGLLFLSGREGGQQVWLADFDPATGATSNAKKLTAIATEADNAQWSPDGNRSCLLRRSIPIARRSRPPTSTPATNATPIATRAAAASKVKAQIFTHLLYRHWNHYTGDKRSHLFLVSVDNGAMRDLTPNDPHDVPPFTLEGGGGFAIAPDSKELAFTENLDPEPAISANADIFTLDLTNPAAKPVKVSTSPGGNFNPAYSPDGKYLAWRSQARAGYESDKFRLMLYDRDGEDDQGFAARSLITGWMNLRGRPNSKTIYFFAAAMAAEAPIFEATVDLPRRALKTAIRSMVQFW